MGRFAPGPTKDSAVLWIIVPAAVISGLSSSERPLGSGPVILVGAALALLAAVLAPEVGLAVLAALAPLVPPRASRPRASNLMLVGALLLGCIYRLPMADRGCG